MKRAVKEWAEVLAIPSQNKEIVESFVIDSRQVTPGSLFFALKGNVVDGHDFLLEVKARGAVAAVVDSSYSLDIEGLDLLRVQDVLAALQALASWKHKQRKITTVGITGSVGKTTTKEFLATLLEEKFSVCKTPGNANSQAGLPLSILQENTESDVFIAEMGMTEKGGISTLVSIAPPDLAILTKIGHSHTLFFPGGLEAVAEAKAEILQHPSTKKAFLHAQTRNFSAIQNNRTLCSPVFYGRTGEAADVLLQQTGQELVIQTESGITTNFTLPFSAGHLKENFLGAALVAKELGMTWEEIFSRTHKLAPYKMRFETLDRNGITYVNDSYNASPESMKAALENLPTPEAGKKVVAVLGEMRELGRFSKQAHEEIGAVASSYADLLLCLGEECKAMASAFQQSGKSALHFSSLIDMKRELLQTITEGDVVLLKASNSLRLWTLLED